MIKITPISAVRIRGEKPLVEDFLKLLMKHQIRYTRTDDHEHCHLKGCLRKDKKPSSTSSKISVIIRINHKDIEQIDMVAKEFEQGGHRLHVE